MTNPLAAAIIASNPTQAEIIAALWIESGVLDAPSCIQDFEFIQAVKTIERRA